MTDLELQEFIDHGENNFITLAMILGDGWANQAIKIAKEYQAKLRDDNNHCGDPDCDVCV